MNYLWDPDLFRQVVFIGSFSGLVLGLIAGLIGVSIKNFFVSFFNVTT